MPGLNLNIVSFDVPSPPNYGGVIDVFYKIKALHKLGVNIHLHCFEYGRTKQEELKQYCKEIYFYKRKTGVIQQFSFLPYIIFSRRNQKLLSHLNSNEYPILFEGLHTTYYLLKGHFQNRTILFRSHNIEHDYYSSLAKREGNFIKKIYFHKESILLKKALNKLPSHVIIGAISQADQEYLSRFFERTFWLPPFHSNESIQSKIGIGKYVLYHGNLSVSENIEIAEQLIEQFANQKLNLVIAGKNPVDYLTTLISQVENITLIADPSNLDMQNLIQDAHLILLPTNQATGIKLKLIESLYQGRFCIANRAMVDQTQLESLVHFTESEFYAVSLRLMDQVFSQEEIKKRISILDQHYSNKKNSKLIVDLLI